MTKHGHRAEVHDNELRKFENTREEEYSMEREKLRDDANEYRERAQKRDAEKKREEGS